MYMKMQRIIDDILKTQDEELKVFLVDEMKSKENEYDLAKKLKLKHHVAKMILP